MTVLTDVIDLYRYAEERLLRAEALEQPRVRAYADVQGQPDLQAQPRRQICQNYLQIKDLE